MEKIGGLTNLWIWWFFFAKLLATDVKVVGILDDLEIQSYSVGEGSVMILRPSCRKNHEDLNSTVIPAMVTNSQKGSTCKSSIYPGTRRKTS